MPAALRPYAAAFAARFQLMLQYRASAVAGFATQCWWGGIRVMVFAAFYASAPAAAANAPISLSQAITYTWLGQAFLVLLPWLTDPEVGLAVRTVAGALHSLGFASVHDVHVGRYVVVELDANTRQDAERSTREMCERLLANPVIEDFEIASVDAAIGAGGTK